MIFLVLVQFSCCIRSGFCPGKLISMSVQTNLLLYSLVLRNISVYVHSRRKFVRALCGIIHDRSQQKFRVLGLRE